MGGPESRLNSVAVEEEILSEGPKLRDCLLEANPILTPPQLDELFLEYFDFYPDRSGLLWSLDHKTNLFPRPIQKVLLLVSGVAAGGKHELIKSLKRLLPSQIGNLVTATTRPRRPNETEDVDHYFYSLERFLREKNNNQFIETMPEDDRWYGTPKKSIADALNRPEPIIVSDVEIGSGWPSVEDYVNRLSKDTQPNIVKVFVLPTIPAQDYFGSWLPQHRPPKDLNYRGIRAAWEIAHAPERAHFVITNPVRKGLSAVDQEAKLLAQAIQPFLIY